MSMVTRSPFTRGVAKKPRPMSWKTTVSLITAPPGPIVAWRMGIGSERPTWMKAWPPSTVWTICPAFSLREP